MYAFVETSMDFQEWEHSTKVEKKGNLIFTGIHAKEKNRF